MQNFSYSCCAILSFSNLEVTNCFIKEKKNEAKEQGKDISYIKLFHTFLHARLSRVSRGVLKVVIKKECNTQNAT